jgi:hypothetical protein
LILHAEIQASMLLEAIEFFKGGVIEKKLYPLASSHLAGSVLALDSFTAAAGECRRIALGEVLQLIAVRFGGGSFADQLP